MTSKWQWIIQQFSRTLWVRATLYCLLAVVTALAAIVLEPFIPSGLAGSVGADAVDHILDILASSMLAVTTFSLTVMVSAYSAATSNVTPRATRLLMQDTTTQHVLSTFLGSFLYSLVGIIALSAGAYGQAGRVVLYAVTLGVIALVVISLLRWISHLSHFGRVGDTTERVERATHQALEQRQALPFLGGQPLLDASKQPKGAVPLFADGVGYVQHIDTAELEAVAVEYNTTVFVCVLPGSFVHGRTVLVRLAADMTEAIRERVTAAISIGNARSFDQDPRFGLCVLAEIASRALSPAVNDPGTALDVLGRALRVLSCWKHIADSPTAQVAYPHVYVPSLRTDDLLADVFGPIARDGAGLVEVQIRLQKTLLGLTVCDSRCFREAALTQSQRALALAEQALVLEEDRLAVRALARELAALESPP